MKKATISIECGELAPNNGMVKVWWWKEGSELNPNESRAVNISIVAVSIWRHFATMLTCIVGRRLFASLLKKDSMEEILLSREIN